MIHLRFSFKLWHVLDAPLVGHTVYFPTLEQFKKSFGKNPLALLLP
jgi:hypothetical protein